MKSTHQTAPWIVVVCLLLAIPSVCAAWIPDGVPVCTAPANQDNAELTPDGAGGAFYTWIDVRGAEFDIYCQRVDADGIPLWTTDGVPICTREDPQTLPQILADGSGGAFLTWQSIHDYKRDIWAQRVDADGNVLWTVDGIVICDAPEHQAWHALVLDGSGGLIVVWEDERNDHNDLYAQRVDADGNILWAANGVLIAAEESVQRSPRAVSDGQGGAIVVWVDGRNVNTDIYVQRFNGSGSRLWGTLGGIPICTDLDYQRAPRITSDGASGAYITWYDQRGEGLVYIYAQHVDADGNRLWDVDGIPISPVNNDQSNPEIVGDDAGGAVIAWNQRLSGENTLYAQRVTSAGAGLWSDSGVEVSGSIGNLGRPRIVADGEGGAVIAWKADPATTTSWTDVYAQRLDANGVSLWAVDGVAVCTALWDQEHIDLTRSSDGHFILVWDDAREGSQLDIFTSRVAANGVVVPNFLQDYGARYESGVIAVEWRTSAPIPAADFAVLRQTGGDGSDWERIEVRVAGENETYTFEDADLLLGLSYRYRVLYGRHDGNRVLFETASVQVPELATRLLPNVPNPFNPRTTLSFELASPCRADLVVYDLAGRRVRTLVAEPLPAGRHHVEWDGRDEHGQRAASGVYVARFVAEAVRSYHKLVLVK